MHAVRQNGPMRLADKKQPVPPPWRWPWGREPRTEVARVECECGQSALSDHVGMGQENNKLEKFSHLAVVALW